MNNQTKISQRIDSIDRKILELREKKIAIEKEWVDSIKDDVGKILHNKRMFWVDKSRIVKEIEELLNRIYEQSMDKNNGGGQSSKEVDSNQ